MVYECLDKSPIVNVGQTFVTKFGNIRLISVYNNGSGKIGVKPIGLPEEIRNTKDWQVESFYDGLITVKTNFFTLAGRGAHFWVCGLIVVPELNPLRITAITVYEVTNPDMVIADVLINGEGTGTLSIAWGDQGTTTHAINGAGQYYFEKSLPIGSHNICGSIGTTQECSTIIIGEQPTPNILWITAITVYKVTDPDMVIADVLINGEGSGTLTIAWGDQGTTTHAINGAGQYYFEKSLPIGTHNICGSIGTTQECATITLSDDPGPGPSTCPYCETKELQNLKISEFKPDRQVPAGEQYAITIMVHDISVLYGDYVCLCLHDRDTLDLLYSSGAVKIGANEYLSFQISGQMPDKDLKLKLSVVDDNVWPLSDDCEDFRDFKITVGEYKPPLEDEDYLIYVGLVVIVALGIYMIARR